jgi:hypothetical protein
VTIELSPEFDFRRKTPKPKVFDLPTIKIVHIYQSRFSRWFSLTWMTHCNRRPPPC